MAWRGKARKLPFFKKGFIFKAGRGKARQGKERQSKEVTLLQKGNYIYWRGEARHGKERRGKARKLPFFKKGFIFEARLGRARQGMARQAKARKLPFFKKGFIFRKGLIGVVLNLAQLRAHYAKLAGEIKTTESPLKNT